MSEFSIISNANLYYIAEAMGSNATERDARHMIDLLIDAGYEDRTVSDVPENEWLNLCEQASKESEAELMEEAEDWYNATPKAELIAWAASVGLDIGQDNDQLDDEWNSKVIQRRAEMLRRDAGDE